MTIGWRVPLQKVNNEEQNTAPDVCFTNDPQSFAHLQSKAVLVSGFAAVTGMQIVEHKL